MSKQPMTNEERLFVGMYPCGIVYSDRAKTEYGDYQKVAFLPYNTLKLEIRN